MAKLSKEEIAAAEKELLDAEQAIKEKWCALKGHRWDLPAASPFNHDMLECEVICNRCNIHAKVTVTIIPREAKTP